MRWPWSKPEKRESVGYTDGFIRALLASASGTGGADPSASWGLETAAALYSRAFAAAKITGDRTRIEAISPAMMALVGRNLIRSGNDIHVIEMIEGRLSFRPAGNYDIYGGAAEKDWQYRITLNGPDALETRYVQGAGIIHCRYSVDSSRPWRGLSPLAHARDTGALAGSLEKRLSEEAGGNSGYIIPIPSDGGADDQDDDPLATLKRDLANAKGSVILTETVSAGWGEGRASAPMNDWRQARYGFDPPEALKGLRLDSGMAVLNSCAVPLALAGDKVDGTAAREAWRRFIMLSVEPLLKIVALEFSHKLETEVSFDMRNLFAHDIAGRAIAFQKMVAGGMELERAVAASGLMMGDETAA